DRSSDSLSPGRGAAAFGALLSVPLSCVHAVLAENVADDDRETAERRQIGSAAGNADLDAAVDCESRPQLVNRAEVERGDGAALRFLSREPERLDVRIPFVRRGHARRYRYQMLREVRAPARADGTDAVVDVDVSMGTDVGAGQHGQRVVGVARPEALVGVSGRHVDCRQDGKDWQAARIGPQSQLRAELQIAQSGDAAERIALRQKAVRADACLEPREQAEARRERRAERLLVYAGMRVETADLDLQQADV